MTDINRSQCRSSLRIFLTLNESVPVSDDAHIGERC